MERNIEDLTVEEKSAMAKSLLENPIFKFALDEINAEALKLIDESAWDAVKDREFLWGHRRAIKQLRERLERYIAECEWERANKIKNAEQEKP